MARQQMPSAKETYKFPSRFGTHANMVVKENEDGTVICLDEFGEYTTPKDRIDNGLADPNRYAESRLGKLLGGRSPTPE